MDEMHWITEDPFSYEGFEKNAERELSVSFKTRHTPEFFEGTLSLAKDGRYLLKSSCDVQGIAPGQYAIVYTPDCRICLGSGMITTT